jgi:hypothetical protein
MASTGICSLHACGFKHMWMAALCVASLMLVVIVLLVPKSTCHACIDHLAVGTVQCPTPGCVNGLACLALLWTPSSPGCVCLINDSLGCCRHGSASADSCPDTRLAFDMACSGVACARDSSIHRHVHVPRYVWCISYACLALCLVHGMCTVCLVHACLALCLSYQCCATPV